MKKWQLILMAAVLIITSCKKDDNSNPSGGGSGTGNSDISMWNWTSYTTFNSGLVSDQCVSLASSSAGIFLCTDGGGVSAYRNNTWSTYTSSNSNLPNDYVLDASADANGNCYMTCWQSATCKLNGNSIVNFSSSNLWEYGYSCALAPDGKVWFGGSYGLRIYDGTNWTNYSLFDLGINSSVDEIAFDNQGVAWLGTADGLVKFNTTVLDIYTMSNSGLASDNINGILCDNGKIYLALGDGAGSGGLQIFDGTAWTKYDMGNSPMPCTNATSIIKSKDGSIWIGLRDKNMLMTGGVLRFSGSSFQLFQSNNSGLPSNYVEAIAADPISGIWVATNDGGVASFK
jgi:hypothetical protein